MEEVLECLTRIKDLDEEIKKNEQRLKSIPEKIKTLQKEIEKKNAQLTQMKNRLVEIKKLYKLKEVDINENESKINKLNQQIHSVKTNEEYRAILKEIEFLKNTRLAIEEEMINLLEEEEKLKGSIGELEKETKEFVQAKTLEIQRLESEQKEISEEQTKKRFMFEDEIKKLPEDIRKVYERISSARERAICIVTDDGICTGCYTNITPQTLNELKKRNKFILCDSCGRILIYGL
jgi:predicted  nucleic acid-binding Zn-ribbon protein|uniref:C4-type zinc ribbon domain-containing protein n=1 Tax=candidate division WOR-3 bacterium TaxID=2052148 RepID=A0A7V3RHP5_UNCW3